MSLERQWDELDDLAHAQCSASLTDLQAARLEELVANDAELRHDYIVYMQIHAWMERGRAIRHAEVDLIENAEDGLPDAVFPTLSPAALAPLLIADAQPTLPGGLFGNTLHGAVSYFSSGWPMAYMLATVILGIGLLIGSLVPASRPALIGQQSAPLASPRLSRPSMVGRITAMVDCQWDQSQELGVESSALDPRPSTLVSLGDRFRLASGLIEITYNTGAKVILQGPCTYEVESTTGGYLALGKLTARVEKNDRLPPTFESGAGGEGSGDADSPLSTLHSPLFAVRTPTALVTDLGTEFGVEVGQSGNTVAHVFRGIVEVKPDAISGRQAGSNAVRLKENESARVERRQDGRDMVIEVFRGPTNVPPFVRSEQLPALAEKSMSAPLRRWLTYSQQLRNDPDLVAYYTFESRGKDGWLLQNVAATGPALDAQVEGPLWTSGRLPGKFALRFRGPGTSDRVVLPEQERFNFTKPFSLALWFQAAPFRPGAVPSLIAKGGSAWRLQRYGNDTNGLTIDTSFRAADGKNYSLPLPQTEVTDGRWHQVVAVIEPGVSNHRKRLYIDGRLEGEVDVPAPLGHNKDAVWLGRSSAFADREFAGCIDEVAILARALSTTEIETMFNAGNPADALAKETNTR